MTAQAIKQAVSQIIDEPLSRHNLDLHTTLFSQIFTLPHFFATLQQLLNEKHYTYVRHAESEFNIWNTAAQNFGKRYPRNPALYDPCISQKGFYQCTQYPEPESVFDVAYVSPARRTLQTLENIPVSYKKAVVTPLIMERSKVRACVVGTTPDRLRLNFPSFDFKYLKQAYWWRHDYQNEYELNLKRETTESVEARVGLFFLWSLLEPGKRVLIVSHAMLLELINELKYYELPDNAKPYSISTEKIMKLFRRIQSRMASPRL